MGITKDQHDQLKNHLRAVAEILGMKQHSGIEWRGQYSTRYLSTTHGFVLDTEANRQSLNIKFIVL